MYVHVCVGTGVHVYVSKYAYLSAYVCVGTTTSAGPGRDLARSRVQ